MILIKLLIFACLQHVCNPQSWIRYNKLSQISTPLQLQCDNFNRMILNRTYPSTNIFFSMSSRQYFIILSLFFSLNWKGENFEYSFNNIIKTISYQSPQNYYLSKGFCNNQQYEQKILNFTIFGSSTHFFKSMSQLDGVVSIDQMDVYYLQTIQCHVQCKTCSGSSFKECLTCYSGSPVQGVCPKCPQDQPFLSNGKCSKFCEINYLKYYQGTCQTNGNDLQINSAFMKSILTQWKILNSPFHFDIPISIFQNSDYLGIFRYNSGLQISFPLYSSTWCTYKKWILKMALQIYDPIPIDQGINVWVNDIYWSSIFQNSSGIQFHNIITVTSRTTSFINYTQLQLLDVYIYLDSTQFPLQVTIRGNFSDFQGGWGISYTLLSCFFQLNGCSSQVLPFECQTCYSGWYIYRDGSCSTCQNPNQKILGSYCKDFDVETKYSKYITKEYIPNSFNPNYYSQYQIISQTGSNFLMGSDIYYSQITDQYIFGGPLVWSQARFQSVYSQLEPHHSITIGFYIIFGPSFPSEGSFIYQIQQNAPVSKVFSQTNTTCLNQKCLRIYEKVNHNLNSLTIYYECFGSHNEPINAYCGFYNLYIAIHQCQPFCLQCTDENTCTQWSSDYDSAIIQFDYDCTSNQYYDKSQLLCLQCPSMCKKCKAYEIYSYYVQCSECYSTAIINQYFECKCKTNQYIESNQCLDCPQLCKQCLNPNLCTDCVNLNNRYLNNGQCVCYNGYYEVINDPICKLCHILCLTCSGPTNIECLSCDSNKGLQLQGTECKCGSNTFYSLKTLKCVQCHQNCLTCLGETNLQCLSCNPIDNTVLNGFQCLCQKGYYEQDGLCISCPIGQDDSLNQCFNSCKDNSLIWYSIGCYDCDSGFNLINNECIPICGDSLIVGYEQCEDGNNIMFDGCYQCQYQCPVQCLTCDSNTALPCQDVCGDGYQTGTEECDDGNNIQYDGCFQCKFQCQAQCSKCYKGICFECQLGYILNTDLQPPACQEPCYKRSLTKDVSQCFSGVINMSKDCGDCKFYCQGGCKTCNFVTNQCITCLYIGFQPVSYYCQNICGDGLIVTDPNGFFTEDCEDLNTTPNDGCYQCKFQCQPSNICIDCQNNICKSCAQGYLLNVPINKCEPICFDKLLVQLEVCEDTLTSYYKCYKCKAKCQNNCQICSTTHEGCDTCNQGYYKVDSMCYSNCGDSYITDQEECDDGNLIYGDGCYNCRFSCQLQCSVCLKGVCLDCNDGYYLFKNRCYIQNKNDGQIKPMVHEKKQIQQLLCAFEKMNYRYQESVQIIKNDYNCFDNCQDECLLCFKGLCYICIYGYQLIEFKCLKLYQEVCSKYLNDQCIECISGYQLTNQNACIFHTSEQVINGQEDAIEFMNFFPMQVKKYYEYHFEQQEDCGNGMIEITEECDDQNNKRYDGCYDCKFDCVQFCGICIKGECYECQQGYTLIDSQCKLSITDVCVLYQNQQCLQCEHDHEVNQPINKCESKYYINQSILELNFNKEIIEQSQQIKKIIIDNLCDSLCKECDRDKQCITCENGWKLTSNQETCEPICGDSLIVGLEQCDDANTLIGDGCYECQYQCDEHCSNCIKGICEGCELNFTLDEIYNICLIDNEINSEINLFNEIDQKFEIQTYDTCNQNCKVCLAKQCFQCINGFYGEDCISKCGDGIIVFNEECDDQNEIEYDGCHQCKYSCPQNCINCNQGQCIYCESSFYLLQNYCYPINTKGFNYLEFYNKCGNKIIEWNELCDDGNDYQFDGCFQCQFSCDEYCKICQFGKCLICNEGYITDNNFNCQPICGDGLIKFEAEQCEISQLECVNCKFKCQKNCLYCNELQCLKCEKGYIRDNTECYPFCGDNYIIPDVEDCEPGISKFIKHNCVDCKYYCPEGCEECFEGYCLGCFIGYQFKNYNCEPICGDGMVVGDEECDDGNQINYDGCFECFITCPNECEICVDRQCNKCKGSAKLTNNTCVEQPEQQVQESICGNGILEDNEDCDDANDTKLDGCFNCKIEKQFICDDFGTCEFQKQPEMLLKYLNQTLSKQYVQLEFSEEIFLVTNQSLLQILSITLQNEGASSFNSHPTENENQKIVIEIEILEQLQSKPNLIISLAESVYNIHGQEVLNSNVSIQLKFYEVIETQVVQQAASLQNANQKIIYASFGVGGISVLMGDIDLFFESLQILQYQSYIKYINLNYPDTLLIYFQSSEVITVSPLFKFLKIDQLLGMLSLNNEEINTSQGKFEYYQENTNLISNLFVQFCQTFFAVLILYNDNLIKWIVRYILKSHIYFNFIIWCSENIGPRQSMKLNKLIQTLPKNIMRFKQKISICKIRTLLIANAWDILFKTLLFINSNSFQINTQMIISYFLSFAIIYTYVLAILKSLMQNNFSPSITQNFYEGLELTRIFMFQCILVFSQKSQVIQISLITMLNFIFIVQLLRTRKLFDFSDFIVKNTIEMSLTLVTLSSFIYLDDFTDFFNINTKIQAAQIQIFLMIGGVGIIFFKTTFAKMIKLIYFFQKRSISLEAQPNHDES